MRYRFAGNRMIAMDAKEPFRKTDLSPREQLDEWRKELARLEGYERMTTQETKREFPDLSSTKRIAELKQKISSLDYWFNDSAPPQGITTLADLNRRNATFWEGRR